MYRCLRAAELPVRAGRRAGGTDGLEDVSHTERLPAIHVEAREFDILVVRLEQLGELASEVDLRDNYHPLVLEERIDLVRRQRPDHARREGVGFDPLRGEAVDGLGNRAQGAAPGQKADIGGRVAI